MKYYALTFKFFGKVAIKLFMDSKEFSEHLGKLYYAFGAPSQIGTCSVKAETAEEALEKAKEWFKKDGWL